MDIRAVIFVPALAGCAIFGFVFALFAAHNYLTVLQSTGSGAKQVVWASEPILDNFWKVFYLTWLIGLWLGPAWILGIALASSTQHVWLRYAIPLLVLWICYPMSQLASLSGPTIWLPLHHDVFARLARKPNLVLGFLLFSVPTLALLGLGFHLTFIEPGLHWLVLGSPLLVAAMLLYARLLGRLAFALMFTRSILSRRKKKKPRREEPTEVKSAPDGEFSDEPSQPYDDTDIDRDSGFVQPSDLPPIQTPDEGELHGYNVQFADEPPKPNKKRIRAVLADDDISPKRENSRESARRREPVSDCPRRSIADEDDDVTSYGVHAPEVEKGNRAPVDVVKPSEMEMRLLNRDDAPKPPKQVWTAEVFAFAFQPDALVVIGMLSVMCMAFGGMVRIAREFNPVAGN